MKALIAKMDQLEQVDEEAKKKPDEDGDGVPDWADKKPGKDDNEDKEKVDEVSRNYAMDKSRKAEKKAWDYEDEGKAKSNMANTFGKDPKDADKLDKESAEAYKKSSKKMKQNEKFRQYAANKKVDEAIAIQADGGEAMALLDILKLAGRPAPQESSCGCGMTEEDSDPTYTNTPDEKISDMSAATPSGNDMHAPTDSWRAAAGADNPMVAAMEGKLKKMFESLSNEVVNELDSKTKQAWLDKAVPDHYDKFVGKKPTTKQKLDTRRATIQKVSKELHGKKQFTDIDPVTGKWSND